MASSCGLHRGTPPSGFGVSWIQMCPESKHTAHGEARSTGQRLSTPLTRRVLEHVDNPFPRNRDDTRVVTEVEAHHTHCGACCDTDSIKLVRGCSARARSGQMVVFGSLVAHAAFPRPETESIGGSSEKPRGKTQEYELRDNPTRVVMGRVDVVASHSKASWPSLLSTKMHR